MNYLKKYMRIFRVVPLFAFVIYGVLLFIGILGNPFSDENIQGVFKQIDINELYSNIEEQKYGNDRRNKQVKGISGRSYISNDNKVKIIFGKRKNKSSDPFELIRNCNNNEFHIIYLNNKEEDCVLKKDVRDPNIHPLPAFSKIIIKNEEHYSILGTIADGNAASGIDRLSYLSNSVWQSTKLSFMSLIIFIIFGLYFAIMIGYYKDRFKFINNINQFIIKAFESIPIILWVLITIIIFDYNDAINSTTKIAIYFSLFGLFSSPALANLIIEKINQMKNEDFIVALKLLGLKDRKIIFSHMLKYYCMPIIYFQMAYIMVHAFFLDITLSFIERNSPDILTFGSYVISSSRNSLLFGNDFNYLIIPAFIIAFVFYKIATIVKSKL